MKVAFLTLGCKVNYYETEKMMADFREHGFDITEFSDKADVYVINTCTVTNIADRKSRQMIHRAKKGNPDSLVVAAGCYVESGGERLKTDPSIDLFLSNKEKQSVAQKVIAYIKDAVSEDEASLVLPGASSGLDEGSLVLPEASSVSSEGCPQGETAMERTRKYIKIQDGCNQFCSYCMIPYVRGGGVLVSRDEDDVVREIEEVAAKGYKEVVITGIHLSSYGVDKTAEKQFVALKGEPLIRVLQRINGIPGIERIRLSSLEPRIINWEFLEGLKGVTKLCPHFHLSLQSGCDSVLKRMNRHYTAEEYREKCGMLREYYKHPAITTDIIVGFPGETEDEFDATRKFVREIRFADIHVFQYSARSGTRAAEMKDQISPDIKHKRSEILIRDAKKLTADYTDWFVGREEKVLFEEVRKINGNEYLTGHNERYVRIGILRKEADAAGFKENEICPVRVDKTNLF